MNEKVTIEKKASQKNSIFRLVVSAFAIAFQIVWLLLLFQIVEQNYIHWAGQLVSVLSIVFVLAIYSRRQNAAIKMPWIMMILVFPLLGCVMYLLIGLNGGPRRMRKRFAKIDALTIPLIKQNRPILKKLKEENKGLANQSRYLLRCGGFPIYQNTDVEFYAEAEEAFEAQLEELRKAENFIFLEYHAIEAQGSFERVREILKEKVQEGLDVRVFYDDIGSIGFIDSSFTKSMNEDGIKCRDFNPMLPLINIVMNNRDHRKMMIVDGKVGFTGGYNLADEYFNITSPYGHWKDTGVKLTGDAVRSLTIFFLEMWNADRNKDGFNDPFTKEAMMRFLPETDYVAKSQAYVQPYADTPLDHEYTGENVYMNVVNNAKDYVYFVTPYLVLTDEMTRILNLAANRGVDVRIITPGIPDKKIIYKATRSYYGPLVRNGVRIFEYTPGFCHAKEVISDDITCTCGTINLDYRSLYHHFENGVLIHDVETTQVMRRDFMDMLEQSKEVTDEYRNHRRMFGRLGDLLLRLIAPLM